MLDDPLTRTCVIREVYRRRLTEQKLLPPPVPRDGGGWVFLRMRAAMTSPVPRSFSRNADVDSVYEVFNDGKGWFVFATDSDQEIGPFDTIPAALAQAKTQASQDGYIILDELPWDDQDILKYPFK
jgi:hypothetical protein